VNDNPHPAQPQHRAGGSGEAIRRGVCGGASHHDGDLVPPRGPTMSPEAAYWCSPPPLSSLPLPSPREEAVSQSAGVFKSAPEEHAPVAAGGARRRRRLNPSPDLGPARSWSQSPGRGGGSRLLAPGGGIHSGHTASKLAWRGALPWRTGAALHLRQLCRLATTFCYEIV